MDVIRLRRKTRVWKRALLHVDAKHSYWQTVVAALAQVSIPHNLPEDLANATMQFTLGVAFLAEDEQCGNFEVLQHIKQYISQTNLLIKQHVKWSKTQFLEKVAGDINTASEHHNATQA